jgi:hypothetical protein
MMWSKNSKAIDHDRNGGRSLNNPLLETQKLRALSGRFLHGGVFKPKDPVAPLHWTARCVGPL